MKSRGSKTWKLRLMSPKRFSLAGSGQVLRSVLLSQVDHLALLSNADHGCEAEWASEHVLGEALEALEVSRQHKEGVVSATRDCTLPSPSV